MILDMNMKGCMIKNMEINNNTFYKDNTLPAYLLAAADDLICNAFTRGADKGIILNKTVIEEATFWNLIVLPNNQVMIKESTSNLYWTFTPPSVINFIRLMPLTDDPSLIQTFTQTNLTSDDYPLFHLNDTFGSYASYSRLPPREGDLLATSFEEVAYAIFRFIPVPPI